jgi:hypothetical protein
MKGGTLHACCPENDAGHDRADIYTCRRRGIFRKTVCAHLVRLDERDARESIGRLRGEELLQDLLALLLLRRRLGLLILHLLLRRDAALHNVPCRCPSWFACGALSASCGRWIGAGPQERRQAGLATKRARGNARGTRRTIDMADDDVFSRLAAKQQELERSA